ncbi:heptaprenyl diphosphate synthase component 1 [Lysinibacillus irui]|uniref:Heptaprenyl diphosphate synthase component 1 n=1 Tax=Lysinibacillus irui TaxID=2998077 RepID=A0AAJ5UV50_9BACI|nr:MULTISPECIES: heptaprenyl diphosphate synthase component 1 [Lysinibacillus]MEA0552137.1 heptaprenyl diphosphate synthase component 1 [Lysinibacillus irui]MEA0563137.1 heptaprenyl diphosphate synthase component 1 [Lysinibacillus irui]MEA0978062.1 heptaprenyl diphosphate synthase component 1 [Lysinibacillus irui]MEA1044216.1 heptaprenyl diphosphate synthase component 1 [Lysinibacillus irui]WDV08173.1 heptaprenyl diphosphate synthase component 1 [Lysinibacillus irui]
MNATYIQNSIAQLKTEIFMDVRHRTLQKYTGVPVIDENQLFYLLIPFLNGEEWQQEQQEAAITVGIVYAALAAHDHIKELDATSKEQQLTVLAGDFYSGRYYELLAMSGNVALIRSLSQGIVARCEHQIKVYEAEQRTKEQWYASMSTIESGLIAQFFALYSFSEYIPLIEKSLLILRLEREWTAYQRGQQMSLMGKALEESVRRNDATFNSVIQEKIVHLKTELLQLIEQASFLQSDIKQALHAHVEASIASTNG